MSSPSHKEIYSLLYQAALQLRIDSIRATSASGSGHPTTCLSAADVVAAIFFHELKYDVSNPNNPNNDRFILSKGHAAPLLYAAWKALGVITDEQLLSLRKFDSAFEGHPTPRFAYNEAATGSLGQGLGIGVGMAINAKIDKLDYRTFVLLGDGEMAEGSVWEAAELASKQNLDNLVAIVDCNRLGQSGEALHGSEGSMYAAKFESFGWKSIVIDGHRIIPILDALQEASENKNQPTIIIAETLKGFGLEGIEGKSGFHGKPFKSEEVPALIEQLRKRFGVTQTFDRNNYKPTMPTATALSNKVENVVMDLDKDKNSAFFDSNKKISTRKAFGYGLAAAGRASKAVVALDADVKNSTFSDFFEKENPERFVQCYIAEQNMISASTGLQARGKIAFASTFGAFFCRAYDQIRMAAVGKNALRLCGSHCGVSIGQDGPSQMALEDIAMIRAVPNSVVLYPSDGVSAFKMVELAANYNDGVSYIRTTRADTPILYGKDEQFKIGGSKVLKNENGARACIVAAGITLHEALKAYEILKNKSVSVSVIDLYSVKPLDVKTLVDMAKASNNTLIAVEDHYAQGGIGEAVIAAVCNLGIKVHMLAVNNVSRSGEPEELMAYAGIDAASIVKAVEKLG